ncbi:hypothetical protein [Asticcacaulis sp. AND118]|uniref:hypothetical protein n=1 Tax=Asticcacaulis sp. AND118 TaxID=2840468 RepID=UPI001CFF6DF5|nr:hypothetical protein [Asticcacaulis sp. AND118]UDF04593.1 hypothetical protein LH365_06015 [Asticcacaulis sp. AND118]
MSEISERLLDQRLRNRIMEAIHSLTEGLGSWGANEYFNAFYDFMDGDRPWPNKAMSENEHEALLELCLLMNAACEDTPQTLTDESFIATGWPDRIKPVAQKTLTVFLERGRSNENTDEATPSISEGESWLRLVSDQSGKMS